MWAVWSGFWCLLSPMHPLFSLRSSSTKAYTQEQYSTSRAPHNLSPPPSCPWWNLEKEAYARAQVRLLASLPGLKLLIRLIIWGWQERTWDRGQGFRGHPRLPFPTSHVNGWEGQPVWGEGYTGTPGLFLPPGVRTWDKSKRACHISTGQPLVKKCPGWLWEACL